MKKQGVNMSTEIALLKDRKSSLKHTSVPDKFITCKICTVSFPTKLKLRKHMKKIHSDIILNEPCPYQGCNTILRNRRSLHGHIKMLHSEETQRSMCDQCDYSSKYKPDLMKHNRRHTGDLMQCEFCNYSCTRIDSLSTMGFWQPEPNLS